LTRKGEPFAGHDVSLNSISDLIVKLAITPGFHLRESLGIARASSKGRKERANAAE
jgi:hypothetical protein